MIIKYNRTSTRNQDGNRFKLDQDEYDLTLNDFGVSGKILFAKREKGAQLLDLVKAGKVDKVVFEDLSRVGRTLKDTINIMSLLVDDYNVQVSIRNLNLHSHIDGKPNPVWTLMVGVMGSIYEMERDRILEITEQGRRQYVLDGGRLGRPSNSIEPKKKFINKPQSKRILSLIKKGKGNNDIIGRLNCSPKTVTKVKRVAKELEII